MKSKRLDEFMVTTSTVSGLGKCRVCGRPLSDPNSIQKGIGPDCEKRLGLVRSRLEKGMTRAKIARDLDLSEQVIEIIIEMLDNAGNNLTVNKDNKDDEVIEEKTLWTRYEGKEYLLGFAWEKVVSSRFDAVIKVLSQEVEFTIQEEGQLVAIPSTRRLQGEDRENIKPDFTLREDMSSHRIFLDVKLRFKSIKVKDLTYLYYYSKSRLIFIIFEAPQEADHWRQHFEAIIKNRVKRFNEFYREDPNFIPLDLNDVLKRVQWISRKGVGTSDDNLIQELQEHAEKLSQDFIPFCTPCPYCGKNNFNYKTDHANHVWIHENEATCQYCGRNDFQYKKDYFDHLWLHENDPVACPTCGKCGFKTKASYYDHLWIHRNDVACPYCSKDNFEYKSQRDDHVKIHERDVTCVYCGKKDFMYWSTFSTHVWVHENPMICPYCGKDDILSKSSFQEHVWIHQNDAECPYCGKTGFQYKASYSDHVWVHENDATCRHCGKSDFQYKTSFDKHVWRHKNPEACPHCGKTGMKSKSTFKDHVWVHENDATCRHCGKSDFQYKSTFMDHLWKHDNAHLKCSHCSKGPEQFGDKKSFMRHVKKYGAKLLR